MPSYHSIYKEFHSIDELKEALEIEICRNKIEKTLKNDSLLRSYAEELSEMADYTYKSYLRTLIDLKAFLNSKNKGWIELNDVLFIDYFRRLRRKGAFDTSTGIARPNNPRSLRDKWRSISAFLTWIIEISEEKEELSLIKRSMIKNSELLHPYG